ncbi:unnamed protein product [Urochloa humidicola]
MHGGTRRRRREHNKAGCLAMAVAAAQGRHAPTGSRRCGGQPEARRADGRRIDGRPAADDERHGGGPARGVAVEQGSSGGAVEP